MDFKTGGEDLPPSYEFSQHAAATSSFGAAALPETFPTSSSSSITGHLQSQVASLPLRIRASQLQGYVKALISTPPDQLTLVFQSFAFKRGIPVDADYVFDVRMLPNPHYEPELRDLNGLDAPVASFLRQQPEVELMCLHIQQFLAHWLEVLAKNHRSYVTVAIGCTGGQHRSVYLVEQLAKIFSSRWASLRRHRELDARA